MQRLVGSLLIAPPGSGPDDVQEGSNGEGFLSNIPTHFKMEGIHMVIETRGLHVGRLLCRTSERATKTALERQFISSSAR